MNKFLFLIWLCVLPQKNEGSFKRLQGNSWRANPACFNCSEWSTQLIYNLKCQLTIADLCSNYLPQKNDSSFKHLQGSGWSAIQACSDCFEWLKQLMFRSTCFDITYFQLTIANLCPNCLPQKNEGSFQHLQGGTWQAIPAHFSCS